MSFTERQEHITGTFPWKWVIWSPLLSGHETVNSRSELINVFVSSERLVISPQTIKICLMSQANLHTHPNHEQQTFHGMFKLPWRDVAKGCALFCDSRDFIKNEKMMLTTLSKLVSVQLTRRPSQISVIQYTLTSSLNKERRKSFSKVFILFYNDRKRSLLYYSHGSVSYLLSSLGRVFEV